MRWLIILPVLLFAQAVFATEIADRVSRSASPPQDTTSGILEAVKALEAEAGELDKNGQVQHKPHMTRPHPLVSMIPAADAGQVLEQMGRSFTGNVYRDTYIRWHLLDVVRRADDAQLRSMGNRLVRLIRQNPEFLDVPLRPRYRDEPADIAARWHALHHQSYTVEGYPPFQRHYWGHDSLNRATGLEKARLQKIVDEMDSLRPLWKRFHDPEANAFNDRVEDMNHIIRQYWGELVYTMLRTRDPQMLSLIVREVGRQADQSQLLAFDLMSYVYLAYIDGLLEDYDLAALDRAGEQLFQAIKSKEGFRVYKPGYQHGHERRRNLADSAFHLLQVLRQYDEFPAIATGQQPAAPARPMPPLEPDEAITLSRVQHAMSRGVRALYGIEPEYTFHHDRDAHRHVYEMGQHALAVWAMRAAGEPMPVPWLFRRLSWVLSRDSSQTYDRSMRTTMLATLPAEFWRRWTVRDLLWLNQAMAEGGGFAATWDGGEGDGPGDNIQAFYGLLGLWSAARAGLPTDHEQWLRMYHYWRSAQLPSGAWGRRAAHGKDSVPPEGGEADQVMTAVGLTALNVTQRYLSLTKSSWEPRDGDRQAMAAGLKWFDQHFDLNDASIEDDWFFYIWIVQQLGHASGYRLFNGVDWYETITREILNRQQDNGRWSGPQGAIASTAFAVLYLSQANASISFAKLQYDGAWNNHPQDIYNFSEYAGDYCETDITWQVVTPDLPTHKLLDAPMLYLSVSDAFSFTELQVQRLKDYIAYGGLLVINREKANVQVARSIQRLQVQLFGPDAKATQVPPEHTFYNMRTPVRPAVRIHVVDNGIRPLMAWFANDVGGPLQENNLSHDAFATLMNMYLYIKGCQPTKGRLESNHIVSGDFQPRDTLAVARLHFGGGIDVEPAADAQLAALLGARQRIKLEVSETTPSQLTNEVKVALLSVTGDTRWTQTDVAALRDWLENGGMLWMDAAGGGAASHDKVLELALAFAPDQRPRPLSSRSPIVTGLIDSPRITTQAIAPAYYRRLVLWGEMRSLREPRLATLTINDRQAVILSTDDLTAGWVGLDHWGIYGYSVATARDLITNGLTWLAAQDDAAH